MNGKRCLADTTFLVQECVNHVRRISVHETARCCDFTLHDLVPERNHFLRRHDLPSLSRRKEFAYEPHQCLPTQLRDQAMEPWVFKSFGIMFAMCVFAMLAPFMAKNFSLNPDMTIFTWMFGSGVGIVLFSPHVNVTSLTSQPLQVAVLLVLGVTVGALANIAMGRVALEAPNPALPFAIINASTAIVYGATALLAVVAAKWFGNAEVSMRGCIGIAIVLIGLYLISTAGRVDH